MTVNDVRAVAGPRVIFQAGPSPRGRSTAAEGAGGPRTVTGPRVIFQAVPLRRTGRSDISRGRGGTNGEKL